jgi:hypothetical protein
VRPSKVRGAQASGGYTATVKSGEPSQAIKLDGAGGAPLVRVSGPNGQALLDSTDKGLDYTQDGKVRILRAGPDQGNFTLIGLQDVPAGAYRIEPLPGSVGITAVSGAEDPPEAAVKGSVTTKGDRRTLTFEVVDRPDQRVTFYEKGADGAAKEIGTTDKTSGKLNWNPAPGRGQRQVTAKFELSGMPAEELNVTRFRPPSPVLARPAALKVKRAKKNRINVSWKKVPSAKSYEITVTTSSGKQIFRTSKSTKATIPGVATSVSGTVTVAAVAEYREGRTSSAKFKRTSRAAGMFSDLDRCTIKKKKVNCR